MMSAEASAAVAAWLQFVGIVGAAIAAVIVANRQLSAYNKALITANENERLRNSLKVLDDMRAVTNQGDAVGGTEYGRRRRGGVSVGVSVY